MTVENTLSLTEASRSRWDVIVVGAGPAGAVTARQLAHYGMKILLVERKSFPRSKVCGACLNNRTLDILMQVGLGHLFDRRRAVPLTDLEIFSPRQSVAVTLPGGIAFSRKGLDELLVREAIQSGVEFMSGVTATLGELVDSKLSRTLSLKPNDSDAIQVEASIVLLADGLGNSTLKNYPEYRSRADSASRIGMGGVLTDPPINYEAGKIYMAVSSQGYVGLTKVEDGSLNIAAALNANSLSKPSSSEVPSPAEVMHNILNDAGLPELDYLEQVNWTGTLPLSRAVKAPALPRVIMCGDAAGYVEPFTGEGISSALHGAVLAASLIHQRKENWDSAAEKAWNSIYHTQIRKRYHWCRWVTRLSQHIGAVETTLWAMKCFPVITRPILGHLNEPMKPVSL